MKKKLLVIAAPGGIYTTNLLRSVNADIKRCQNKFQSPNFGAFTEKEMIILRDPTLADINDAKKNMKADLSVTIYTGHAGTDSQGRRILQLTNKEELYDTDLLNGNDREIVLVDGCGDFIDSGISGLDEEISVYSSFSGQDLSAERAVFDNMIRQCGKAKLILHATKPGQSAIARPNGGAFLTSLLNGASKFKGEVGQYKLLTIKNTASSLYKELGKLAEKQTPTITFKQGDTDNLPFAIGLPIEAKKEEKSNALRNLLLFGLGVGAVALIVNSSNKS